MSTKPQINPNNDAKLRKPNSWDADTHSEDTHISARSDEAQANTQSTEKES